MSSNKTQNYNLHAWEPEDDFLRTEFNQNFAALDAQLKGLSDAVSAEAAAREAAITAEQQARSQALSAEASAWEQAVSAEQTAREQAVTALNTGKAELVLGVYEGDGAEDRTIQLGFTPKAVLFFQRGAETSHSSFAYGGLILPESAVYCPGTSVLAAEIVSGGFRLASSAYGQVNVEGYKYNYLAVK